MPDGDRRTSDPLEQAPTGVSSDTGRPLTDLAEGDVVVPTYIPADRSTRGNGTDHEYRPGDSRILVRPGAADDEYANSVHLRESNGPLGPSTAVLEDPNHPPVDIAGLTWAWDDFDRSTSPASARSRFRSIWAASTVGRRTFIEGLRAFQSTVPRANSFQTAPTDCRSPAPTGMADAEIVASDDRFKLTSRASRKSGVYEAGGNDRPRHDDVRRQPAGSQRG